MSKAKLVTEQLKRDLKEGIESLEPVAFKFKDNKLANLIFNNKELHNHLKSQVGKTLPNTFKLSDDVELELNKVGRSLMKYTILEVSDISVVLMLRKPDSVDVVTLGLYGEEVMINLPLKLIKALK